MSFGLPMCEHTNDSELVVSGTDDEGSILMVNISDGAGEVSVYGKDLQVIVEGTAESFEGTMNADELLDFTAAGSVNDASGTFELTGTCAPTDYLSGSSE